MRCVPTFVPSIPMTTGIIGVGRDMFGCSLVERLLGWRSTRARRRHERTCVTCRKEGSNIHVQCLSDSGLAPASEGGSQF